MMFIRIFLCLMMCLTLVSEEAEQKFDTSAFASVVVQHQGRLKPIDTFARSSLLGFHGKQRFAKQQASEWLMDVLTNRNLAYELKVFTIRSPAVVQSIGVKAEKENRYSLAQLKDAFMTHEPLIRALAEREDSELDETETQLVQKYNQVTFYVMLIQSTSCFWPDIVINDAALAKQFGVQPGAKLSYFFFADNRATLRQVLLDSSKKKEADQNYDDSALRDLWQVLDKRPVQESGMNFAVLPPAKGGEQWRSPWDILNASSMNDADQVLMRTLNDAFAALHDGDQDAFNTHVQTYKDAVQYRDRIDLEVSYNSADLFYRAMYFYIGAFLCILVLGMTKQPTWRKLALVLMYTGAALHLTGVGMRMYIMTRPPVTTLYESVLFASLISVATGLLVEHYRKDATGLLAASFIAVVLSFIGFSYAAEGDTMGMLEAVLDSDFWLATHVLTIIIGYGVSMIAGLYGHMMLVQLIQFPEDKEKNKEMLTTARGIALVALFFTTLGTILGGIWADQSWGRFWGWDPKENGALLIVLWLLIAIHGHISGEIKQIGFAMFLSLTTVCVALAWFGVNLLSVGLHSYGFSDKTAVALFLFCGLELVIVTVAAAWAKLKQRELQSAAV